MCIRDRGAGGNVIKHAVAEDVVLHILGCDIAPAFAQNDRQLHLVIQCLVQTGMTFHAFLRTGHPAAPLGKIHGNFRLLHVDCGGAFLIMCPVVDANTQAVSYTHLEDRIKALMTKMGML